MAPFPASADTVVPVAMAQDAIAATLSHQIDSNLLASNLARARQRMITARGRRAVCFAPLRQCLTPFACPESCRALSLPLCLSLSHGPRLLWRGGGYPPRSRRTLMIPTLRVGKGAPLLRMAFPTDRRCTRPEALIDVLFPVMMHWLWLVRLEPHPPHSRRTLIVPAVRVDPSAPLGGVALPTGRLRSIPERCIDASAIRPLSRLWRCLVLWKGDLERGWPRSHLRIR